MPRATPLQQQLTALAFKMPEHAVGTWLPTLVKGGAGDLKERVEQLESVIRQNAEDIHTVQSDLKSAVAAIEQGAETIEARFRRLELLVYFSVALSVLCAVAVLTLWLH